jgi:hypothetical protein
METKKQTNKSRYTQMPGASWADKIYGSSMWNLIRVTHFDASNFEVAARFFFFVKIVQPRIKQLYVLRRSTP